MAESARSIEQVLYGLPPRLVSVVGPPLVGSGCTTGRHCAAHGSGPFHCCLCGATFALASDQDETA